MSSSAQGPKTETARAAAQTRADAPTNGMARGVNRRSTAAETIPDEGTQEEGTIATAAPRLDSAPRAPATASTHHALATATADRTPATEPDHHSADASNRETVTQAAHRRATIADAATAATPRTTGEAAKAATTADATGATAETPLRTGDAAQAQMSHSTTPRRRTRTRTKRPGKSPNRQKEIDNHARPSTKKSCAKF